MRLVQLRRESEHALMLKWDDGHQGPVSLISLRDACPCAECSGESILFARYTPPEPDRSRPARYTLIRAEPVGNYAIKLAWGDGHELGLYTWELLRGLCSCEECQRSRTSRQTGERGA
jgi:DUF971 family protein